MGYFTDKIALVTGGGGGLGGAIARRIAGEGAFVYILDIDQVNGLETENQIRVKGGAARFMKVDVTRYKEFSAAVETICREKDRIDLLVNNAGISITGEVRDLDVAHWHNVLGLNITGVVHGISLVYPRMAIHGSGQVVNIGSMVGLAPVPLIGPYVTSKYAITGLTRSLRLEGKSLGIKVNLVCPGRIATALLDTSEVIGADRELFLSKVPFPATPVEKAAGIVVRGIVRNRAVIAFPTYVKWLWWADRYLPFLLKPFYRHSLRKFREIRSVRKTSSDQTASSDHLTWSGQGTSSDNQKEET